ncbi:hypothetical protein [Streptomyces sp. NPDC056452]|uniref:hypothetical protein n=1 Tax=Streptomyces sp. NPDC056452 TaxID=3345821 RepID=UPI0036D05487
MALRIEDPAAEPDLAGLETELKPVIAALPAKDPDHRPAPEKVTRQLVAVIRGFGLAPGGAMPTLTARTSAVPLPDMQRERFRPGRHGCDSAPPHRSFPQLNAPTTIVATPALYGWYRWPDIAAHCATDPDDALDLYGTRLCCYAVKRSS